ncbi:GAF domain-containing protein [Fictibacillus sp. S7]|uniref:GAF domain-containing protein n=1 Tax=Fictibacillus sp. S7 TaxID=2212476 RepID=UPI0019D6D500|nr:GAF domain-containing protein [Fictibacillus sp. S7]
MIDTDVQRGKYYPLKFIGSLLCGLILAVIVVSTLVAGAIELIDKLGGPKYAFIRVFTFIAYTISGIVCTVLTARWLRTRSPEMQQFGFNMPNPFYSKYAVLREKIGDTELLKENQKIKKQLQENGERLDESGRLLIATAKKLSEGVNREIKLRKLIEIFERNTKNTSRLVRSLHTLLSEHKEGWKKEFMDNVLNECVTCLYSNKSDKSASLFLINEYNKLKIFAYYRIDTKSAREKSFAKGEGFAGEVWELGDTKTLADVYKDGGWSHKKEHLDHYTSIIGTPIWVKGNIIGVLCIQSEDKAEFKQDDEVMIRSYADICGLAELCDMIIKQEEIETAVTIETDPERGVKNGSD